ncbi:MAG: hypothetical protein ABEJ03_01155 [Candidatus Nanohaloarchaea archaeon]
MEVEDGEITLDDSQELSFGISSESLEELGFSKEDGDMLASDLYDENGDDFKDFF